MRLATILGAIAAASASLVVTIDRGQGARSYPFQGKSPAPNDEGPVVDTTRESKRARRRRLAKGDQHGKFR